ncbi:hypothetical protein BCR33DRAFT_419140 [Rhizoclosmatium globosum]|uniref:Uncharacterized protein n=1 Tax=Rhizoclosmatium globosum TaxID=329046 RepID=A0A1Y2BWN9_9FUNG|nr:hypothetical protein BCR33DRAFT_419140 [Rhizoclosmatium globosum]|eukprot:ORY39171.1 hypothetical protein BCR33DRAFT_419140 [Rhizoclosmatium globosum]
MQSPPSSESTVSADSFLCEIQGLFSTLPGPGTCASVVSSEPLGDASTTTFSTSAASVQSAYAAFKASLAAFLRRENVDGSSARRLFLAASKRFKSTSPRVLVTGSPSSHALRSTTASPVTMREQRRVRRRNDMPRTALELKVLEIMAMVQAPLIAQRQREAHAEMMRDTRELLSLGLF